MNLQLSSAPSQRTSASPFAFSDSGSPFAPPLDPPTRAPDLDDLFAGIPEGTPDEDERCCFGEVILDATSSKQLGEGNFRVPVELRFTPNVINLYAEGSHEYVGLLNSQGIRDLVQLFEVTLSATLWCPSDKKKKCGKSGQLSPEPRTVHIVVYGLRKDMNEIGELLQNFKIFLQHPMEYDNRLEYFNPQYLLGPGERMPRPENAVFHAVSNNKSFDRFLEKHSKAELLQVFDSASGPLLFSEVTQSPRLKTNLKRYQQKALAMMAEKECGVLENAAFEPLWQVSTTEGGTRYRHIVTGTTQAGQPTPIMGGILADDMGLGKTLSTLALVAWFLDHVDNNVSPHAPSPRTTLIIAPKSTLPGWEEQIKSHVLPGQMNLALYHGTSRDRVSSVLHDHDIVITTYSTLRSEWKSKNGTSPLFQNTWARVVLDEAHHIRGRSTQTFKAASAIRASRRWCLTGTPIQNRLDDYGSLLAFIGIPPFVSKPAFEYWIGSPVQKNLPEGLLRLKRLVTATCLRRTKDVVRDELGLPRRSIRERIVHLDPHDREIYDFFKRNASHLIADKQILDNENAFQPGTGNILPIINTLRLICNHGQSLLSKPALAAWTQRCSSDALWGSSRHSVRTCYSCRTNSTSCDVPSEFTCSHFLCSRCEDTDDDYQSKVDDVVCPRCAQDDDRSYTSSSLNSLVESQPSAKVRALVGNLRNEQQCHEPASDGKPIKSVVFTFWKRMLDLLEIALRQEGFGFERIDVQKSLAQRISALSSFKNDDKCTVFIATIGSIGEGVDLTAANFVHLLEPHWNPMVEEQALDRVHRMGQTRDVVATRYITDHSIEMYVRDVKREKNAAHQPIPRSCGLGIGTRDGLANKFARRISMNSNGELVMLITTKLQAAPFFVHFNLSGLSPQAS
ncbi:hypothetical protein CEP52_016004 [Fusarium oligoseptatum]|uniref:Uncharacterized protein n=1 Tax=Fusarium oligoseptatum TaxID=2604345 RepID=A0A428S7M3_9HYPO|nr:hypothetical protein CEP52_016004 [Fusarium oligoseptatum]